MKSNLDCGAGNTGCEAQPTRIADAGDRKADAADEPVDAAHDTKPIAIADDAGKPAQSDSSPNSHPAVDAGVSTAPTKSNPSDVDAGAVSDAPDKLDLLFVVDNSNSMVSEQASLRAALPKLMDALATGKSSNRESLQFAGVRDLHVGVVSTDMGAGEYDVGGCHPDGGGDGRLLHAAQGSGCAPSYPSFLSYVADTHQDVGQLAKDFACIADLGSGGCGFEQPLEASLKALWPSTYLDNNGQVVTPNPVQFLSTAINHVQGRGDLPAADGGNLGFLQNDASDGRSLIAIVVVTDEDDCSVRNAEILAPPNVLPEDSPYRSQDINLRCHYNPDALYNIQSRYLAAFQQLRQDQPDRVVFATIAGVPTDLVDRDALRGVDFQDRPTSDAFYDHLLNDPRMQDTIDPATKPGTGTGDVTPSCNRKNALGGDETAAPPRRLVQLARLFGDHGIVQSICQDDFTPAVDAIVSLLGKHLRGSHP